MTLLVQESLKRDPHGGHLFAFRGRRADLIKIVWHDGQGACLFSKRLVEAACWAHRRRKFFELADLRKAPLAIEAVRRIDAAIEREINGLTAEAGAALRSDRSRPLVDGLETSLREQRGKLSSQADPAKAIDYMLRRWPAFTRFLADGRICISNNAAERALRGIAVGRRNWTFAGSDAGGRRAAAMYTLIETCKPNEVDPRAWLADVLRRLPQHPAARADELLPWRWKVLALPDAAMISHVFTIRRVAQILSQNEDLLWNLSDQLEPGDGMLWVHDVDDGETLAFTAQGIEALREMIEDQLDRAR